MREKRMELSNRHKTDPVKDVSLDIEILEIAYRFARIINHQQGFALMKSVSDANKWSLPLDEIARIWTNGCIIRSKFMVDAIEYFKTVDDLLDNPDITRSLSKNENDVAELLRIGLSNRVALPAFSSAWNYWVAMSAESLPANLIQAQRNYFGAHPYLRTDALSDQAFQTDWSGI